MMMINDYLSDVVSGWADTGYAEKFTTIAPSDSKYMGRGQIVGINWIIGNATDAITMTGKIYDPAGHVLHSKTSLAKNTTTVENMSGVDIPMIYEGCYIGFTPSGNSGATHITGQAQIMYVVLG